MRDLQRLEKLSSAAAMGLWADDVILALDRAVRKAPLPAAEARVLASAAEVLDAALQQSEEPLTAPRAARGLAATNTTLSLVASMARGQGVEDENALLRSMAAVLRKAGAGSLSEDAAGTVGTVIQLFGMIGEHQLAESYSVLSSRKDARTWTATPPTSISS